MVWKLVLTRLVTTSPMNAERAVRSARALALGRYLRAAAAARTLATVWSLTRLDPFSAREAVLTDTPLCCATWRRPTANLCPLPGAPDTLPARPVRTFPHAPASPPPHPRTPAVTTPGTSERDGRHRAAVPLGRGSAAVGAERRERLADREVLVCPHAPPRLVPAPRRQLLCASPSP